MNGSGDELARKAERDLASLLYAGPFHAAFRAAVHERGLALDRLRAHLAQRGITVGLSSLSDWQQGRRRPCGANSLRAVHALEEILGLPPRSLIRLLVKPRRLGAAPDGGLRRKPDDHSGALAELLDDLPGSRQRDMDVVNNQEKVFLDSQGRTSAIWFRMVVRVRCDGADRYILRYFGDPGCRIDRVEPDALENCRLGEIRRHPAGVLVAELLFDDVLRAGETWVFEGRLSDGTGRPCTEHAHGFRQPGEQYLLQVCFDPVALPVRCHTFAQPGLYDERHRTAELTPTRHHTVHLLAPGGNAGLLGIGWSWD